MPARKGRRERSKKKLNLTVEQKRELSTGFKYIRIQQRQNGTKFFLSARDVRSKDRNHRKHVRSHSILEQQLYVLWSARYLPSGPSPLKHQGQYQNIETELRKFCESYNNQLKEFLINMFIMIRR